MDDLVAFLTARLDEDEALAQRALESPWETESDDYRGLKDEILVVWHSDPAAGLFLHYDPARILREVAAKRAIAELHTGGHECSGWNDTHGEFDNCMYFHDFDVCTTLRHLAAVYSDHPGYRQEWAADHGITSPPS